MIIKVSQPINVARTINYSMHLANKKNKLLYTTSILKRIQVTLKKLLSYALSLHHVNY